MPLFIGSTWKKWNLHIHSPASALNNHFTAVPPKDKWDTYIDLLAQQDFSALAITDYFSIEGYLKVKKYFDAGRLPKLDFLLPNIEMRLIPATAKGTSINIHILCNPEIVDELESLLFTRLTTRFNGNEFNCTRPDLIRLGREFGGKDLSEEKAYETGVNQFKIELTNLTGVLRKNDRLKNNSIIGVANSNQDGASAIQHDASLKAIRQEIYRAARVVFSSTPSDIDYFLGKKTSPLEVITNAGSLKPCVNGCDAHENAKIGKRHDNRFTYIKAEPTFSGLLQITYEPAARVIITDNPPRLPVHRINHVSLDFPAGSTLGPDEPFCLGGQYDIGFSPYFTCIIGGRGTGKSTLLNLIAKKLDHFLDIKGGDGIFGPSRKKLDIKNHITIDNDKEKKNIEYLSQNEIEEFAKNEQKLTEAIYSRISLLDLNEEINKSHLRLMEKLVDIEEFIGKKIRLKEINDSISQKKQEIESYKNIIETFESDKYRELTQGVDDSLEQLNQITLAQTKYYNLLERLNEITNEYQSLQFNNDYTTASHALISMLRNVIEENDKINFSAILQQKNNLHITYEKAKESLNSYLITIGVSKEDSKEISNANAQIKKLSREIDEETILVNDLTSWLESYDHQEAIDSRDNYVQFLRKHVQQIQSTLEALNTNKSLVRTIDMKLEFDTEKAQDTIVEHFKRIFKTQIDAYRKRIPFDISALDKLILTLASNDPAPLPADYISIINTDPTRSNAKQFLLELFNQPAYSEVFHQIMQRSLLDYYEHKIIKVLYDHKPIESASFGQRCTAALVILLLLGNSPIIIDEPEAHLDSMLISNYLVEVIKRRKTERQIIFATHNANFVINGDAELIHIMEVDEGTNLTRILSTTIENRNTREKLIALEGGFDAFQRRENRYSENVKV
jgi:energy-coupling factor transporter ATP-binding protein EcfA2